MSVPILEQWWVEGTSISGNIHGHPKRKDGKTITTSYIESVDESQEGVFIIITHSGSKYRLGAPYHGKRSEHLEAVRLIPGFYKTLLETPTIVE